MEKHYTEKIPAKILATVITLLMIIAAFSLFSRNACAFEYSDKTQQEYIPEVEANNTYEITLSDILHAINYMQVDEATDVSELIILLDGIFGKLESLTETMEQMAYYTVYYIRQIEGFMLEIDDYSEYYNENYIKILLAEISEMLAIMIAVNSDEINYIDELQADTQEVRTYQVVFQLSGFTRNGGGTLHQFVPYGNRALMPFLVPIDPNHATNVTPVLLDAATRQRITDLIVTGPMNILIVTSEYYYREIDRERDGALLDKLSEIIEQREEHHVQILDVALIIVAVLSASVGATLGVVVWITWKM